MSLEVIINHLNQAIILKTENGNVGYCNDVGLSFIRSIAEKLFEGNLEIGKYLDKLGSMEFLMNSAFSNEKDNDGEKNH